MLWHTIQRFAKDDDGLIAVMSALLLPILLSAAVLATEVGMWAMRHQQMQGSSDAAALAGVVAKSTGTVVTLNGQAVTALAGYVHGSDGVSVTINKPPNSGLYATRTDAVEAIIQKTYSPLVAKFISSNPVTVRARSVAVPNPAGACVLALDKSVDGAITLQGSASVTLNGCDAMANSNSPSAIAASGASTMTVETAAAVGGISGASHISASSGFKPNAQEVPDPYASVIYPGYSSAAVQSFPKDGTITPGVWKGDIKGEVTLMSGIYYVDAGSFKVNASASLSGIGVTIVLVNITGWPTGGQPMINGNSTVNLSALTTGPTAGIVLFGDRSMPSDSTVKINGTSSQTWKGAVYVPTANLEFTGNAAGTNGCTQIIANKVTFTGNANLAMKCVGAGTTAASNQVAVLVE